MNMDVLDRNFLLASLAAMAIARRRPCECRPRKHKSPRPCHQIAAAFPDALCRPVAPIGCAGRLLFTIVVGIFALITKVSCFNVYCSQCVSLMPSLARVVIR